MWCRLVPIVRGIWLPSIRIFSGNVLLLLDTMWLPKQWIMNYLCWYLTRQEWGANLPAYRPKFAISSNINETGTKEETRAILTEMEGSPLGGFGFLKPDRGWVLITANGGLQSYGSIPRPRMPCGAAVYVSQLAIASPMMPPPSLGVPSTRINQGVISRRWPTVSRGLMNHTTRSPLTGESLRPGENSYRRLTPLTGRKTTRGVVFPDLRSRTCHGRLEAVSIFQKIREAQPEVSPLHFLISEWEGATYRYISEVMDGARRLLRMIPDNVRKTEYRRKALAPGVRGEHRWEFPTTWLAEHHTVYLEIDRYPQNGGANFKVSMEGRVASTD